MRPSFRLAISVLMLLTPAARAALVLRGSVDGRDLPLAEIRDGRALFRTDDGSLVDAPPNVIWSIEGDLRTEPELIDWTPSCLIQHLPDDSEFRVKTTVGIGPVKSRRGARPTHSYDQPVWPEPRAEATVFIAAWMQGGRATATQVFIPTKQDGEALGDGSRLLSFRISDADRSGSVVHLAWSRGAFVAPKRTKPFAAQVPLVAAAVCDDVDTLARLLDESGGAAGQNKLAQTGVEQLFDAATRAGADASMALLMGRFPKLLRPRDAFGWSLLGLAAAQGHRTIVMRLLDAGVDVEPPNDEASALYRAAESGHVEIVEDLLRHGAPPERPAWRDRTPLDAALARHDVATSRVLLAAGARLDTDAPLHEDKLRVAVRDGRLALARFILEARAATHATPPKSLQPLLILAAHSGSAEMVRLLLEFGADCDSRLDTGATALHVAAESGNVDTVAALLAAGADPRKTASEGLTALHIGARHQDSAIVRLLLEHGADPHATVGDGTTSLHLALAAGAGEVARELTATGAKIDIAQSGLMADAVILDLAGLVTDAIHRGWDPRAPLRGAWRAVDIARVFEATATLAEFEKAGVPLDEPLPIRIVPPKTLDHPLRQIGPTKLFDPRNGNRTYSSATVVVEMLIGSDGVPLMTRIKSTEDSTLAAFSREASKTMRFSPPTRDGEPVGTRVLFPIKFAARDERVYRETDPIESAAVRKRVAPVYPVEAKTSGVTGTVVVRFIVERDGRPREVRAVSHTAQVLVAPACAAIAQWEFEPAMKDGTPVREEMELPIVFSLN